MSCKHFRLNEASSKILSVPLPQPASFEGYEKGASIAELEYNVNFHDCIKLFQNDTTFSVHCQNCKESTLHAKINYLEKFPKYLVVHVKNLVVHGWIPRK
jgi:uncharacterized UBP type Zn finger protein